MDELQKSQVQTEKDYKKVQAWLRAVIPSNWDRYDLKSKYDPKLTYLENKRFILEEIKIFEDYKGDTLRERAEHALAQQEKLMAEEATRVAQEIEDYNKTVQTFSNKEMDVFYEPIDRAVRKVCDGFSNLVFIKGRGGTGKSRRIRKVLTEKAVPFYEVTGNMTEAFLYRALYEQNGKTIWFREIPGLLRGLNSIHILKAATETENVRLLTKNNYSRVQADLPPEFIFTGRVIFDYNEIGPLALQEDFEALVTRGDFVEFAMSEDDTKVIMGHIAQTPEEKEATKFLIENWTGTELLNLRSQYKAFKTFEYAKAAGKDWKEELKKELLSMTTEVKSTVYTLIGYKAVRVSELIRDMLKYKVVATHKTANNRIRDWLAMGELKMLSHERDFFVSLDELK